MRIFVNNVDGFLAGAICADLMKLSHSIMGTQKGSIPELVPPMVKKIIPRIEVRKLLKAVASCDLVVYDLHDADLEELELVLRTLHTSELTQEMTFILVSSVGIWARTQREFELVPDTDIRPPEEPDVASDAGGSVAPAVPAAPPPAAGAAPQPGSNRVSVNLGEEELPAAPETLEQVEEEAPVLPKRPALLTGEDYIRRVPTPKFQEWKSIETLALALKRKTTVRPYVVCAGIPYGNGEEAFLGLFKAAWQNKDTLRIIGSGQNYIPTVHARDCARLVRILVEDKPSMDYHLAVDRGDVTQRALIQSVADEFGINYEIESVNVAEAVLAELADVLTMDLRLEPSPLMAPSPQAGEVASAGGGSVAGDGRRSDGSKGEGSRAASAEPVPEQLPIRFRWWCEEGPAANIGKVAEEFCRWRRLDPVRFIVLGPPGSPTSELSARLASRYALPSLVFDSFVEDIKNKDTPLGQQLRERLEEVAAALANPKSQGPFLLPAALTTQLAEAALDIKLAQYHGWVLADYPQTAEECALTFLEDAPPKDPEEGEEAGSDSPGAEAPPAPAPTQAKPGGKGAADAVAEVEKVPRTSLAPDVLVLLNCAEEWCLERAQASEAHVSDREFQLKMDRWKKENPEEARSGSHSRRPSLKPSGGASKDGHRPNSEGGRLSGFFVEKFGCEVVNSYITEETDLDAEVQKIAEVLEGRRCVRNFLPPVQPAAVGQAEEDPKEERTKNSEELARAEAELRKKRKDQEERLEQIRREEHARLERHSEPLRQYMSGLVVPTLASGLVEVCRKQPKDPVGYLAEYLAVYAELARKHGKKPGKMP